jgi:hypothetical protein
MHKIIHVQKIVGRNAISMNSGNKLKELIIQEWPKNEKISLDFSEIDIFASPFFNAAIGALLKDRTIDELQVKLDFPHISGHGRNLLNLVISNAIKFYSDSEGKTDLGLDEIQKDL